MERLQQAVLQKVIRKEDIYCNTNPKELKAFLNCIDDQIEKKPFGKQWELQLSINPICPMPRICVSLCKYTYERIEKLDFQNFKFGKGQYAFHPVKLSRFDEKVKFVGNTRIS